MIYTFIYFKKNVLPKYALIFQTLQKFGNCHFRDILFFWSNVVRMDSSIVFQRIRTNIYTFIYFADIFFLIN